MENDGIGVRKEEHINNVSDEVVHNVVHNEVPS